MATTFYLPATAATTPISPTPAAEWEDTGSVFRAVTRTSTIGSTMATVSFADSNAADRDCLIAQYVSYPLTAGQTVTGSQSIKAQVRCQEVSASNNLFLTVGIRVLSQDGGTVRKVVLTPTRDGTELNAASLQNRQFTATSAATNYTTQAGDYLVLEIGVGGDPTGSNDHDSSLRLGDSAASDLSEDDTSTTDNRPWVQLTDTLTFAPYTATAAVTTGVTTASGSATHVTPTFTAAAAVAVGGAAAAGAATFSVASARRKYRLVIAKCLKLR